jgi:plasmid stabilization system protein ParE
MHNIRINPLALKDLQEIKKYITEELESPVAAINVISSIIESYEKLKKFPLLGGELAAKINISTDFRYLVSGNYIVFLQRMAKLDWYIIQRFCRWYAKKTKRRHTSVWHQVNKMLKQQKLLKLA